MTDGPVDVMSIDEQALDVDGSTADQYSMHDAPLAASRRALGSDAIVSKDAAFDDLYTVWETGAARDGRRELEKVGVASV